MQVNYEGRDITKSAEIKECTFTEGSGGRSDWMKMVLENADEWWKWGPGKDDKVRVMKGGYDTGVLYVQAILPEQGRYTILAASAPSAAKGQKWASYEDRTLGAIMGICAAECGMTHRLYGIESGISYPYLIRRNETPTAFIERLLRMEGGTLKCVGGRMTGIGIRYAQELRAADTIALDEYTEGARYIRRDDLRIGQITVRTPLATAMARDRAGGREIVLNDLPAKTSAQAGRWARGLLTSHNRQCEEIRLAMDFSPGFTAMARIDVRSRTAADGKWLIDEVEHDFAGKRTRARLLRCIETA